MLTTSNHLPLFLDSDHCSVGAGFHCLQHLSMYIPRRHSELANYQNHPAVYMLALLVWHKLAGSATAYRSSHWLSLSSLLSDTIHLQTVLAFLQSLRSRNALFPLYTCRGGAQEGVRPLYSSQGKIPALIPHCPTHTFLQHQQKENITTARVIDLHAYSASTAE